MKLRDIPSVNALLENLDWKSVQLPRDYVTAIVRGAVATLRRLAADGEIPLSEDELVEQVKRAVARANDISLRQVINGTGIVLHTGLGRAPYSRATLRKLVSQMEGYAALEIDLNSGKRGERTDHVSPLISVLAGADASLVVNNNAAAVLLALNSTADGREVIISRGQLVEIGGSFRIPEVIAKSGARLVEVGTTNRTHFKDYVAAISGDTGAILTVHTSNYRILGFTREVPVKELALLARKHHLPLIVDLGSGALFNLEAAGLPYEPVVSEVLSQGADLVTFSGDKLLGGPQSGVICGKKRLISALHRNSLYRAVRCDKMTLLLLELTLRSYRDTPPGKDNLTYLLLTTSRKTLMSRGKRLLSSLKQTTVKKLGLTVIPSRVEAGSGSLPTETMPSAALRFDCPTMKPTVLAKQFRSWDVPILGYISGNRFYIDLKTVLAKQYTMLSRAIKEIGHSV